MSYRSKVGSRKPRASLCLQIHLSGPWNIQRDIPGIRICWHYKMRRIHIKHIQITDLKKNQKTWAHIPAQAWNVRTAWPPLQTCVCSGLCRALSDPFYAFALISLPTEPWPPLPWLLHTVESLVMCLKVFAYLYNRDISPQCWMH